jgi:hypothetical protein
MVMMVGLLAGCVLNHLDGYSQEWLMMFVNNVTIGRRTDDRMSADSLIHSSIEIELPLGRPYT